MNADKEAQEEALKLAREILMAPEYGDEIDEESALRLAQLTVEMLG